MPVEASLKLASREIAQNKVTSLNDYTALPCPTEAQYQAYASEVNLIIPEGPSVDLVCDDSYRALLAKTFYLMKELKINFPENWPLELKNDLGNSFDFLKRNSAKLTLDMTQEDSVAYNKVNDREIYLGGRFFSMPPLDAISVLIHEARHSVKTSPNHVTCEAGDVPRSSGACDEEFSMSSTAGAYSYGTLFEASLALYGENLSTADREAMLISALVQLGARFNILPDELARKVDVLITLSTDHELEIVHPFLNLTIPLNLKFSSEKEIPVRIEFSPQHNGILIHTNLNRAWSWSQNTGLKPLYEKLLTDIPIRHAARLRVPFNDITSFVVLTDKGQLKFVEYSTTLNANQLRGYTNPTGRPISTFPPFTTFFLALGHESTYLDKDGKIYFAPFYGNEPVFGQFDVFKDSHWTHGTGGVIYDTLYLINDEGQLKVASNEAVEDDDMVSRKFTLQDSNIGQNVKMKKFAEGLKLRMALDQDGSILAWKSGQSLEKPIQLKKKILDFVISQNVETKKRPIGKVTKTEASFIRSCSVEKLLQDPWLGRGIGITNQGQLVMAGVPGSSSPCVYTKFRELKTLIPYIDRE